jgi:hypothetical protein
MNPTACKQSASNSQNSGNSQDAVTLISFSRPIFTEIQVVNRLHYS